MIKQIHLRRKNSFLVTHTNVTKTNNKGVFFSLHRILYSPFLFILNIYTFCIEYTFAREKKTMQFFHSTSFFLIRENIVWTNIEGQRERSRWLQIQIFHMAYLNAQASITSVSFIVNTKKKEERLWFLSCSKFFSQ